MVQGTDCRRLEGILSGPLRRKEVIMGQQKKGINLTKEEIQEMIKNLEPGTMITVEMLELKESEKDSDS